MRYADPEACQSGGHCRLCRRLNEGREFRLAVLQDFEVPILRAKAADADEQCPNGWWPRDRP